MNISMRPNNYPGKLITFCGLDGSGKTTYITKLAQCLKIRGYSCVVTRQPTNEVRKSSIFRTYMDQEDHSQYEYRALSLYAASDRLQHTEKYIVPHLLKGDIVISDRYYYSCLANLRARGYKEDQWIYEIGSFLVQPDVAIFLDVNVEKAIYRVRSRASESDRYIDVPLQYRLRDEYLEIAESIGATVISTENSEDDCFEQLIVAIKRHGINV